MPGTTREQVAQALFAIAQALTSSPAVPGVTPFGFCSRKLVLWNDANRENRPSIYLAERVQNFRGSERPVPPVRTFHFSFFIYTDAKACNDTNPGSAILNPLLDMVEKALTPSGADILTGRQTLGGLVNNAYIDGDIFFDPGDIDGDGLAIIPIKVIVP